MNVKAEQQPLSKNSRGAKVHWDVNSTWLNVFIVVFPLGLKLDLGAGKQP
jgi:hypothetical protein